MASSTPRLRLEGVFDHATLVRAFNQLDANRSGRIGTHESWIDVQDFDVNLNHSVELWEYMEALRLLGRGGGEPFPGLSRFADLQWLDSSSWIGHWQRVHKTDPNGVQEQSIQPLRNQMVDRLVAVGLTGDQLMALGSAVNRIQNRHSQWEATLVLPAVFESLKKGGYSIESSLDVALGLLQHVPEGIVEAGDQIVDHAADVRASLGEVSAVQLLTQLVRLSGPLAGPVLKCMGRRLEEKVLLQTTLTYQQALEAALQVIRTSDPDRAAAFLRGDLASGREVPNTSPGVAVVLAKGEELLGSLQKWERWLARSLLIDGHPLREAAVSLHDAGVTAHDWTNILVALITRRWGNRPVEAAPQYPEKVTVDAGHLRDGATILKGIGVSPEEITRLARLGPEGFDVGASLVKSLSKRGFSLDEAITVSRETVKYAGQYVMEAGKAVESLHDHGIPPAELLGSLKRVIDPAGGDRKEPYVQLPIFLEAGYSVAEIGAIFRVVEPKSTKQEATDKNLDDVLRPPSKPDNRTDDLRYQTVLERLKWLTGQGWNRAEAVALVADLCAHSSLDAVAVTKELKAAISELSGSEGRPPRSEIHSALSQIASGAGSSTGEAFIHLVGAYRALRVLGFAPTAALKQLVQIAQARRHATARAYEGLSAVNP